MRHYEREWNDLMQFIVNRKITGVIFLTGDRHYSEVIAYTPTGGYPLYDITSSPLTSSPFKGVATSSEANTPGRLEGSLFAEQSYMQLSISGEKDKRQLTIQTFNMEGKEVWKKNIAASEMRWPK